jgi:hypothetical protein
MQQCGNNYGTSNFVKRQKKQLLQTAQPIILKMPL